MTTLHLAILTTLFAPVPPAKPGTLQGTWVLVKGDATGKHQLDEVAPGQRWRIGEKEITVTEPGEAQTVGFKLDSTATPKAVDLTFNGRWRGATFRGVYELSGDTLRVRYSKGSNRPASFTPDYEERGTVTLEFKREPRPSPTPPAGTRPR